MTIVKSLLKVILFLARCNLKTEIEQVYVIAKLNRKVTSQNLWENNCNVHYKK